MTRDEIINLAKQSGMADPSPYSTPWERQIQAMERFADLAASAEREACAKLCEAQERLSGDVVTFYVATWRCAAAIRERDAARGSANEKAAADGPFMDWKSLVSVARSA